MAAERDFRQKAKSLLYKEEVSDWVYAQILRKVTVQAPTWRKGKERAGRRKGKPSDLRQLPCLGERNVHVCACV